MANSNASEALEALAAEIGENIYIDVAKWHLYLSDAHLHTTVADRTSSLIEDDSISEAAVRKILQAIPVQLGGGKAELPLADLVPTSGVSRLVEILEDYRDKL
ncbi:DUF3181 family protein [Oscillatoria sp. FACHB-1406]|uniref:DUF3181 family protein n=1 Tax=Oscillatoria sp. FACHB-1406 TaxID=2692846 RepID=UPI00168211CB|nr:DUF3181 family protein [Oscillatoria sp. FACHB-1406]MBD2579806.1 DUF3181 family protein [Oscillatoria sp. FACHB-1406]